MAKRDVNIIIKARDQASKQFGQVTRATERFSNKLVRTSSATSGANIAMGALAGTAITAAVAFRGLKAAVSDAADFESLSLAFNTLIGDASKAGVLMKELEDFSIKTPFTPEEVLRASKMLISFGIETEKVSETMRVLGDVSAGTGKDLNKLARIYGKVFTKGRAQAEELNQFAEAGIPIIQELAKMYGVTGAEVIKMGEKSQLAFSDIETAFKRITSEGGRFHKMTQTQSKTTAGKLSTLDGNIKKTSRGIGQFFTPTIKTLANIFNDDLIPALNETIEGFARIRGLNIPDFSAVAKRKRRPIISGSIRFHGRHDLVGLVDTMDKADALMRRFKLTRGQAEVASTRTGENQIRFIEQAQKHNQLRKKGKDDALKREEAEKRATFRIQAQIQGIKEQQKIQKMILAGKEKEAFVSRQISRANKVRLLTDKERLALTREAGKLFDLQKSKKDKAKDDKLSGTLDRGPVSATISRFRTFSDSGKQKSANDNVNANKKTAENTQRMTDIMEARLNFDMLKQQELTLKLAANDYA